MSQKRNRRQTAEKAEAPTEKQIEEKVKVPASEPADLPEEKPLQEKIEDYNGAINDHVVTKEDIKDLPELKDAGVKVGDELDFGKPDLDGNEPDEQPEKTAEQNSSAKEENQQGPIYDYVTSFPPGFSFDKKESSEESEQQHPPAEEEKKETTKKPEDFEVVNNVAVSSEEAYKHSVIERRKARLAERNDPNREKNRRKF